MKAKLEDRVNYEKWKILSGWVLHFFFFFYIYIKNDRCGTCIWQNDEGKAQTAASLYRA